MSPFLTWLISLLGPALLEVVKDWLLSLFKGEGPGFSSLPRTAQVAKAFASAIDVHHAAGDQLRKQRSSLRWYQWGQWLSLNRDIGRHGRRTRLLVLLRDVAMQAAREGRFRLRDDEAVDIADAAEAVV